MQSLVGSIEIPPLPEFASAEEKMAWLVARHDALEFENAELRIKNQIFLNQLYGRKSEKVKAADETMGQQRLFETDVVDEADQTTTESTDETSKDQPRGRGKAVKRDHARKPVNPELASIERIHGADEPRFQANGKPMTITAWDVRERLHHIPEQVVRLIDKYAIWGDPITKETIEITPKLPCVILGGKLSDDFLIEIARRKYLLSLPLYRQAHDFNAHGAELAVSTMCDGVRALADFLNPIHKAINAQILRETVIHIDETTMRQQSDTHGIVQRYLWGWHAKRQVSFHYGTRAGNEVRTVLGDRAPPGTSVSGTPPPQRYAVTDGYAGYDAPLADAGFIHAGCWAHIRRSFKAIAPSWTHAREIFTEITELYKCEKAAKKQIEKNRLTGEAADACRLEHRTQSAQPAMDRIASLVERYRPLYGPKTMIGEALTTLANQFPKLRVYASTGCVPIDNNTVERDMRQVAVGRKNYLFVGSEDAGGWCATMYSLIESARLCNLQVRAYLHRAVAGIHAGEDPETLTPRALRGKVAKAKPQD